MWHELAYNPKAITSLYSDPPDLKGVELNRLELHVDGPALLFWITVYKYPENPPKKWVEWERYYHCKYNVVQIRMRLSLLESVEIEGWNSENAVDISVRKTDKGTVLFEFSGKKNQITVECSGFFIEKFQPYEIRMEES